MNGIKVHFSILVAGAILLLAGGSVARSAEMNTSNVQFDITYQFIEAYVTGTGEPLSHEIDYELDGPVEHFFEYDFVFSEGDGTGWVDGWASTDLVTHQYGDEAPDFSPFDLVNDPVNVYLETFGQSSTPGSNGSAGIESALWFYFYNDTYDEGTETTEPITFSFDYSYLANLSLVEDAPADGEANGFVDVDVAVWGDQTGWTETYGLITEYHGGPKELVDQPGSGILDIEVPAGNSYIELEIRTSVNSTTLVVPEPATMTLLSALGLLLLRRRR
jgi:hypothetical protein